jgi:hypothetical protein
MIKDKIVTDRPLLERMDWQARDVNGTVNLASVASMQDFYKQEKIIDKTAPSGRLVDASFAEAAAKELGKFELINKDSKLKGCR